jgi:hypothetical protein
MDLGRRYRQREVYLYGGGNLVSWGERGGSGVRAEVGVVSILCALYMVEVVFCCWATRRMIAHTRGSGPGGGRAEETR